EQETEWDFAEDCLVTHGPSGTLNMATGVLGLAAMLWLYGVAWHQPMTESIDWMRSSVASAIRWPGAAQTARAVDSGKIGAAATRIVSGSTGAASANAAPGNVVTAKTETASVDPDVATLIAERRATAAAVESNGPPEISSATGDPAPFICTARI